MLYFASAVVLLLVVLNGLFAMSELAVVSSRRPKLQSRAERGSRGAAAALRLAENPTRFLSSVQIGITLIGILAGAYGEATIAAELRRMLATVPPLAPYAEAIATGLVVVAITYLSLIVGELVPKRLALIMPEAIAASVARPLTVLAAVMSPFVSLLTHSTAAVLRLLRVRDRDRTTVTHEEVETVLAEGTGAGLIEPGEHAMMAEVMRLGDRPVRAAMTPRPDVYWVSLDDPEPVLREEVRTCPYTRFVVAEGLDFDNPVGVVHKRDVADQLLSGAPLDLRALASQPLVLPEGASLLSALEQFKASPGHLAFVVDEFGGLVGVLTLTDLMEEIAGEFPEAHDEPGAGAIVRREDGSFLVDGRASLEDLADALGADFPAGREFHTVAGLVLDLAGRLPSEGEVLQVGDYEAEVVDMDGRRIDKLMFRRRGRRGR